MYKFSFMLYSAFVAGTISGCGEDQPNSPAQPGGLNGGFGKETADKMKKANSSFDSKKAKQAQARKAK